MEIMEKNRTRLILRALHVIAWIIFGGLSIDAGGYISNVFWTLAKPEHARNFWGGMNFSSLYSYGAYHFFLETMVMTIITVLKVWMFYLIVKILYNDRLTMSQPFSIELGRFTFRLSYLALSIGSLCYLGTIYTNWLLKEGVSMPDIKYLHMNGADIWLFMGVTIFIIAQIFKRGIEIQSENDLTV